MTRPAPDREQDLRRRISAEEDALAGLHARLNGFVAGDRARLDEHLVRAAGVHTALDAAAERALELAAQLDDAREHVRRVEAAATAIGIKIAEHEEDRARLEAVIVSLRAKVDEEKQRLAPAMDRRHRELEKLQRRLATLLAWEPHRRSSVLTDPSRKSDDSPEVQP